MEGVQRYSSEVFVWAAPMLLKDYAVIRGVTVPDNEDENANGYIVEQMGTQPNCEGFGSSIVWMVKEYFDSKFTISNVIKKVTVADDTLEQLTVLDERVKKLEVYLKCEAFAALSQAEQNNLSGLLQGMRDHLWFLSRIVRNKGAHNVVA